MKQETNDNWKLDAGLHVLIVTMLVCVMSACSIPPNDVSTPDVEATVKARVEQELSSMPTELPPTPVQGARLTPTLVAWNRTGYWYRDTNFERASDIYFGINESEDEHKTKAAVLNPISHSDHKDMVLLLMCRSYGPAMYLIPHGSDTIHSDGSTYSFGIWNGASNYHKELLQYDIRYDITDNKDGIHIGNPDAWRKVISIIRTAANSFSAGDIFAAEVWSVDPKAPPVMISEFDPEGVEDALEYRAIASKTAFSNFGTEG